MKSKVYVESHNIISPLGKTSDHIFTKMKNGESSVLEQYNIAYDLEPFWASILNDLNKIGKIA